MRRALELKIIMHANIETLTRFLAPACLVLAGLHLVSNTGKTAPPPPPAAVTWKFDSIDQIAGHKTTVLGHPKVIDSPVGKAVEFNGVDDALFVDVHPLAGAETFTWEILFRPDLGGAPEQRFFHMAEKDPKTGEDSNTRLLSEIRVIGDRWCLDSFALSGSESKALIDREKQIGRAHV